MSRPSLPFGAVLLSCALACGSVALAADRMAPGSADPSAKMVTVSADTAPSGVAASLLDATRVDAERPAAGVPSCARKVKVVYSGYGEADRAPCGLASVDKVR